MSGVYIADTECTSLDAPEVIELAWLKLAPTSGLAGASDAIPQPLLKDAETYERRYQPKKPSTYGALCVHHILPVELEGCWPSELAKLPEDCEYIVAHNADHDWKCLGSPPAVKRIDTCSIARWLWQDTDAYSQSALLYYLLGPTPETRKRLQSAHSAAVDVMNCALLLEGILAAKPDITTWSQLYAYSEQCRIPRTMPIGEKQGVKGLTLDEAVEYDMGFVDWCLRQSFVDDYLKTGLRQAIERYHNPPPVEPDTRPICSKGDCVYVDGHAGECDSIPF